VKQVGLVSDDALDQIGAVREVAGKRLDSLGTLEDRAGRGAQGHPCSTRLRVDRADAVYDLVACPPRPELAEWQAEGPMDLDLEDPTLFLRDDVVADPRPQAPDPTSRSVAV
jgi:hypothetical protein